MGDGFRRFVPALIAGVVAVVVLTWLWSRPRAPGVESERRSDIAAPAPLKPLPEKRQPPAALPEAREEQQAEAPVEAPVAAAPAPGEEGETSGEMDEQDQITTAWAKVDMDAVREAMPDNLYFKLSSPTQDEAVLAEREAERARWNVEYGKILSGTGTEEEINAYYDLRARLATDYVEFATYLLDHYGNDLYPRDVRMLELARTLNAKRLEEIPRQIEEATQRKQQQDEARAAWLAGNKELGELQPDNR